MFEQFPYTDMHQLNLDWIIKIAKDFLDQYTSIQQIIADGEQSLHDATQDGLNDLQEKANTLQGLLDAWYTEHSADIANQLADALQDLNDWYTEHSGFLDQYVSDSIAAFNTAAETKAAETIASIPADYSTFYKAFENLQNSLLNVKYGIPANVYKHSGFLKANGTFDSDQTTSCLTTQPITCKPGDVFKYKGVGQYSAVSVLYYLKGEIVSSVQYNSPAAFTSVTIPAGVDTVVFSSFAINPAIPVLEIIPPYTQTLKIPKYNYSDLIYFTSFIADTYLDKNDGSEESAEGAVCTDFISLTNIEFFMVGGATAFSAAGANIYDYNQNFITSIIANVNPFGEILFVDDIKQQYPSAYSIRFSSLFHAAHPLTVYGYAKPNIKSFIHTDGILEYKSYYALGDSFTHGDWNNDSSHPNWESDPTLYDASKQSYKTYPYWIAVRNNMDLHNLSGNGYRLVDHIVGREIYKQVPTDADYCTLMIGLNDGTLNKPLGTIDSTDPTTFYGCLNIIMTYYRANRPQMHFSVLILPNLKSAYANALKECAIKYGYPYLDFYNDPSIPAFMAYNDLNSAKAGMDVSVSAQVTAANRVSNDNWHPNMEAHKHMSNWVEEFIKKT